MSEDHVRILYFSADVRTDLDRLSRSDLDLITHISHTRAIIVVPINHANGFFNFFPFEGSLLLLSSFIFLFFQIFLSTFLFL